jgi:trehalose 6-phosphate phosphatase
LATALAPLTRDRAHSALFCDIDGTLAPIVARPEDTRVPQDVTSILGQLAQRYACIACVSGRRATDARRLVGQSDITYAGLHGAELLAPGQSTPRLRAGLEQGSAQVQRFLADHATNEVRALGIGLEHKGPIVAFHWRGAPDDQAAHARIEGIAAEAQASGLATLWGRKVLEVRPPVPINKGQAVCDLIAAYEPSTALFGGDDTTDLDGFAALDSLIAKRSLQAAVRVAVRSDEGPPKLFEQADIVVDGVAGFAHVLESL